ncbi:SRPBCC family protein [Halocynthiibacter sp.]|uniref:SRPBCC family protein n=1 Tax=Halocynthiibacter sp. TaxID=1979210 RepID=UPI003C32F488
MKFTAKHDIEAPIEEVFAYCSDFPAFEQKAFERGINVARRMTLVQPGAQIGWDIRVKMRGRPRDLQVELTGFEAPNSMTLNAIGGGVTTDLVIDFVSLARNRTRLNVSFDTRPKTMGGRLLVQSLKLAKGTLNRKLQKRLSDFGTRIEDELQNA